MDCEVCDNGFVPVYTDHLCQSVQGPPCPNCSGGLAETYEYHDVDHDGWIDGASVVRSKYHGGLQPLDKIDTVVLHRLENGWGERGPAYVAGPDRVVSWHATIHRPDFAHPFTQHLPFGRVAWHSRGHNWLSVGWELDGPAGAPFADETVSTVVALLELAVGGMMPALRRVVSHRSQAPGRRTDPAGFPWEALVPLGLVLVP